MDHVAVRESVRQTLHHYEEAGVNWVISGWFKPGISAGAEIAKEPRLHITHIRPQRILDDAPEYKCPVTAIAEEQRLEFAFG